MLYYYVLVQIELEFVDISDDHLQRNITLIPTAVILNLECSGTYKVMSNTTMHAFQVLG